MTGREIAAVFLTILAPIVYFIFFETSMGTVYQTSAGHLLVLFALPIGLVSVWFMERRQPSAGQRPTPVWARLVMGAAAGLLLATAVQAANALYLGEVREVSATSLGTRPAVGFLSGRSVVRLDDGRRLRLLNAFCGVNEAKVTVSMARGLLGLDRVLACILPVTIPPKGEPLAPLPK
ncbi:MAG TPA: hypothetical protein VGC99_18165 [Candidatus Tectomicrobia bacterium]